MERKLYKSDTDKIIDGVAGGLAEYFNVDSVLVRIIFVILAIWGGIGIILYIIGAIVMPESPERRNKMARPKKEVKTEETPRGRKTVAAQEVREPAPKRKWEGEQLFGMIVLGLGIIFLLEAFIPGFSFGKLWPLILIGIGLWLIAGPGRE